MAEFNSYLLGKVTKSVGNITLVYTKRKNIAKAKVFKRKDNPTPEILEQRAKMKTLVQFGRRILPVVRKGFAGVGRGTAFNAFVALNMDKVSFGAGSVATIDYGRLLLASGLLVTPRVTVGYDENRGLILSVRQHRNRKKVLLLWRTKYTACCWKRRCSGCVSLL